MIPESDQLSRQWSDITPIIVAGEQDSSIALYRISKGESTGLPIVLTHGTFSNGSICFQLAKFLAEQGHDCWIYEWMGHGASSFGNLTPNIELYALHDLPRVVEKVLSLSGKSQLHWLAHSGGGFLPLILMARQKEYVDSFRSLTNLGSQTTEAGSGLKGKFVVGLMSAFCKLFGYAPGPKLGMGPEDEVFGFIPQWCHWNWHGRWVGTDGFEYFENLKHIDVPTMSFAGASDFIAPVAGVRRIWEKLPHPENEFYTCSKADGFLEDYNHARLIASSSSSQEIWPRIGHWLMQNA